MTKPVEYIEHAMNGRAVFVRPYQFPAQFLYAIGQTKPHYPVPAIRECYCGIAINNHRDSIPCDYLGFLNYG